MRVPTELTTSEVEILRAGMEDPSIVSDYFFRPPNAAHGWIFDENFTDEGKWQVTVHQAAQKDITVIGGFGTGKTAGVGMSAAVWGLELTDFKFLNIAPKAWQAKLMYDVIITNARNTRFDDLIWEKPRRPHPKITLRFSINKIVYESTLEFMSIDNDATNILSWEGDWLHVDEAGLIDKLEEVIINAGSRLRGAVRGRPRLGRFSMASNSWDNFYLWYYFDQAVADPEHFLSMVISSRSNKNITPDQLQRMVARIPEDERERFIDGSRPEGRGWYFSRESIYACEDKFLGPFVEDQARIMAGGYKWEHLHGAGIVNFRIPANPKHLYMLFGDPGVGGAPQRNAPTLMLWDVSEFPKMPARLSAFWWGNGGGKIGPFIDQMFFLMGVYRPIYVGIDSTGPQKNINYLINEHLFRSRFNNQTLDDDGNMPDFEVGYESPLGPVRGIGAMDFSGNGKNTYLQAARLLIEAKLFVWPLEIVGIRSQLSNYDPDNDKKIPQDIVATMGMSAHAIRMWFHVDPQALLKETYRKFDPNVVEPRRKAEGARNRRAERVRS